MAYTTKTYPQALQRFETKALEELLTTSGEKGEAQAVAAKLAKAQKAPAMPNAKAVKAAWRNVRSAAEKLDKAANTPRSQKLSEALKRSLMQYENASSVTQLRKMLLSQD